MRGWKNNNAPRWCDGSVGKLPHCPLQAEGLVLFGVVRLDGFRLDDNCCITLGERTALGGNGARHITRSKSQGHSNRCSNSQCEVFDCLDKALFLSVS